MATHAAHPGGHTGAVARRRSARGMLVTGWTMFASVLMVFGGLLGVAEGVAALNNDSVLSSPSNYQYLYNLDGWGWIHITLGIVVALAGVALMTRATWARVVGVVLASLSAMANFLWLPHYPLWGAALLAIDVFVIWALCAGMGSGRRGADGGTREEM